VLDYIQSWWSFLDDYNWKEKSKILNQFWILENVGIQISFSDSGFLESWKEPKGIDSLNCEELGKCKKNLILKQ